MIRTGLIVGIAAVLAAAWSVGCTPKAEKKAFESNREFLTRYLDQPDTDFQRQALILVADSSDASQPWAQEIFLRLSGAADPAGASKDALVRQAATFGLFKGEENSVPDLVKLMTSDPSPVVRESAARCLALLAEGGRIAQEDWPAVRQAALDAQSNERDASVQAATIRILGYIRDKAVVEKLIDLLTCENFLLENQAEQSLIHLTGQAFRYDQAAWRKWLAETADPFAKAGQFPPELKKRELNAMERLFVNYRWKPDAEIQSPFKLESWQD